MEIYKDDTGAIVLKGQLLVSEIELSHSKLEPLLDETIHDIVLDLSGLQDIDISGLQLIHAIRKTAASEGTFGIRAASPKIKDIIILAGFESILQEVA